MTTKVPMTITGVERLRAELQELKTETRPKIVAAIAEARAHGDLKENAEYHAAREQQSFVEGRINDIEHKLSYSQIIDVSQLPRSGKVVFGVTVELIDTDSNEESRYQIVGEDEADIKAGRISVNSPIARALLGKEEGDTVEVQVPGGVKNLEITEVLYL